MLKENAVYSFLYGAYAKYSDNEIPNHETARSSSFFRPLYLFSKHLFMTNQTCSIHLLILF